MELPPPLTGSHPVVSWCNRLRAYVASLRPSQSSGVLVTQTPHGMIFKGRPGRPMPAAGGATVGMYKLGNPSDSAQQCVFDDCLLCATWDGSTLGSEFIYIAKPFKLRESLTGETGADGHAYTFTYSTGLNANNKIRAKAYEGYSEDEMVAPCWLVGDIIYAVTCDTGVLDPNDDPVTLLSIGDTRAWTAS